jgi:glycine oxidase
MSLPSVLVIGAGIIGSGVAHALAAAGCAVRVIDRRTPGQGATRASAGLLAPYIEGGESTPLRRLGQESLASYEAFVQRVRQDSGRDVTFSRCGTLEVALTQEEAEKLAAASAALWRVGVEARWVPREALPDEEPGVSPEAVGGLLIPAHAVVGVTSLTLAMAAAAERRGATFLTQTGAITIRPLAAGRVAVQTDTASWDADRVVLAAGSWSSQITVEGADPVPVTPIRGQLLHFTAAPGALRHIVWGTAGYLAPWPDGSVLAGSTVEDVGFDESHTEDGVRGLHAMAASLVPALARAPLAEVRVGLRPRGPDDMPIVGPSSAVPGLIYATAHYRNGVMLMPLTVALVRDLVLGRGVAPDSLRPGRVGRL